MPSHFMFFGGDNKVINFVIPVLLVASATGCPMTPQEVCEQIYEQNCRRFERCNQETFDWYYSSVANCIEDSIGWSKCEVDEADYCPQDPDSYNPSNAGACARATGARACDVPEIPEVCDQLCEP